jgi:high-affinity nickel-transport protein
MLEAFGIIAAVDPRSGGLALLATALVLGIRHGFDWDHLAAIADVTSTTATADAAEAVHETEHDLRRGHEHGHGGAGERLAHGQEAPAADAHPHLAATGEGGLDAARHVPVSAIRPNLGAEQRRALALGSLYALGHATVVVALGLAALAFGAVLPEWVDPIMGRIVGLTLVVLGSWVFVSLYQYARHGTAFRLRSRWMLVFDSVRYGWRRFQAWLHGHEHVDPIEMSSYGPRTAFGVGMIHGIGAETGTQVLLIAAIGGASSEGLGIPMLAAFVVGLLVSNSVIVFVTATGFVASRLRDRVYLTVGVVAGVFSLVVGTIFLFQLEDRLPALDRLFGSLWGA